MKIEKNDNFINWLIANNITSNESAISYDSYVRNALLCLELNMSQVQDVNAVEEVIDVLSRKDTAQKYEKSIKTIQNYLSGLRAYGEFVNDTSTYVEDTAVNLPLIVDTSLDQVYVQEDLFKNFVFRLITQDRFYNDIYFPISLIKQLFYKNDKRKAFDHILEKMINSIKMYDSKQNEILFKDILELKISNNKVVVNQTNKEIEIYTPTENGNSKPFTIDKLSDISIDHVISQHGIMLELKDKLPTFSRLTEILKKSSTEVINRPTLALYKKENGLENILLEININDLENELNSIIGKTELRLMDRKLNTSKGKK